ncbi:hypothetical protein ACJJTC_001941 [Scirpophaga incertulas]
MFCQFFAVLMLAALGCLAIRTKTISAIGGKSSTGALSKGLALDYANGNGLSVSHTSIPNFGSQPGAGRLNLVHNQNHNLDANAFITRNMPNIPKADIPNFNTVGGSLDYMYKNKVGASLGMAKTPFLQRTDYSALGKLNLFHSPTASLDLNAGFGRSISNIPQFSTNWQPQTGLVFTKYW